MSDREALIAMLDRIGYRYDKLASSGEEYIEVPMPDLESWWNFDKDGNLVSIV